MSDNRVFIAGVPLDIVDMDGAIAYADQMIVEGTQCPILAINPEKVMACQTRPELVDCLTSAGLVIADGIGVVIAARLQGAQLKGRVPGAELMPFLCELAAEKGYGIFLFGAKEETNAAAAKRLQVLYPELNIAGRQNGYVAEAETEALIDKINASGAKLLFIALGSPTQEYWIQQHRDKLDVCILQGVGGTFDVIAGTVKRAPKVFRDLHLEWFYRLISNPARIRRQSVLPVFAAKVLGDKFFPAKTKAK
jgi:N-acetylglucosaminyldiphosphoundecaprenol N-acetyl-beta-D-mannosaminyltransferase